MAYVKKTNLRGPQGPAGPTPSLKDVFLQAHPVGSIYLTTESANPGTIYGGTWQTMPSLGPYTWLRTA
ncbi:collagen alpha-1(XVI) chain [Bifidobacterium saguini DSM 23967]|uniref:Collagen alpha-1(XVI) chain n=2 Tax=Bifidobacterium saguini TaxID=762210 RepID=A0A087DA74_9BIFI|nr:hypothetical protein [Bifidobacterium saguini]KFI92424.1 collagen alpha-1(XVI) chain [Bifidobacterium saguini DSM 23967]QTB90849.1 hypothetical protein BSD967_11300 [Bifidobacterium saguini]QTB90898.1 hypothetical protein BSD967_00070 [Bifidobacterium saguini]